MLPIFAQMEPQGFNLNNTIDSLARTPLSIVLYWTLAFTVIRFFVYKPLISAPAHKRHGQLKFVKFIDETMDALIYTGIFVFMVLRPFVFQTFMVPSGSMVSTLLVGDYLVANKGIYRYTHPIPGDIVVFRPPKEACYPNQIDENGEVKVDFVKRCIGTPGDLIEIHDNILYRNGVKWDENYKHYTEPDPPGQMNLFREMTKDEVDTRVDKEDFKIVNYKGDYWPLRIHGDRVNEAGSGIADKFALTDPKEMLEVKKLPAERIPAGHYLMWGDNRLWSFDGRGWGLVTEDNIVGRAEFIWLPFSHMGRTRSEGGAPANR